jgi:hypothetical protein
VRCAGADISFAHGAVVVVDDGGPIEHRTVTVSRRRKAEQWGAYIRRGRHAHMSVLEEIAPLAIGAPLHVELFPERVPNNQHQAPAVSAAAWWVGAWTWGSDYIEIMDWRCTLWPRSLVKAQKDSRSLKRLAIKTVESMGWGWLLDGLNQQQRGDVAEAALIAKAGRLRLARGRS